jgi:hypothetical protein
MSRILIGIVLVAGGVIGCAPAGTASLADMQNKQLAIYGSGNPSDLTVNLLADGCPLLEPGTVEATMNGSPMKVDPGHHGSGFDEGPCYQPTFHLDAFPPDLGPTPTIVIKDATQTLRVEISGFHDHPPQLELPAATPIPVHLGDTLSFAFTGTSATDPPGYASASLFNDGAPAAGSSCVFTYDGMPTLGDGVINMVVPSGLCSGAAKVSACVEFDHEPVVTACKNASCTLYFLSGDCQRYELAVQP